MRLSSLGVNRSASLRSLFDQADSVDGQAQLIGHSFVTMRKSETEANTRHSSCS
jgi:hypothetical protein